MSVMLYPCMFCVALSMDLFVLCVAYLTVFVNCLGVFVILFVELELLSVFGGAVWSSKECVCCACGPSERLNAPSIGLSVVCS